MKHRTLKLESPYIRSVDVERLKRALGLPVDNTFGVNADKAVRDFQSQHGLKVDGICGPKTWAVIDALQTQRCAVYACTMTGKTLEITDDVALWLMRMVVGEGGAKCSTRKTSALCWAIVNRWFLWPGARHYSNFVDMMRAFSQPINPRWGRGGDLAIKAQEAYCHPGKLKRRERICSMQFKDIPKPIRENVELFAKGELLGPELNIEKQRISNWASLKLTSTKYPWGVDIDGDWFFEDENLRDGEVVVR